VKENGVSSQRIACGVFRPVRSLSNGKAVKGLLEPRALPRELTSWFSSAADQLTRSVTYSARHDKWGVYWILFYMSPSINCIFLSDQRQQEEALTSSSSFPFYYPCFIPSSSPLNYTSLIPFLLPFLLPLFFLPLFLKTIITRNCGNN
jgi:hypothetical protein